MARLLIDSLGYFDRLELGVCRLLNRSSNRTVVRQTFRLVSWLGNGWFWYALIGLYVLQNGRYGLLPAVHMLLTGTIGVLFYKLIKEHAVRERPFIKHSAIYCACAPLDKYSFPSGHTLHAVSFTLMLAHYSPALWPALVGFTVLVALSRVILGLHYPTDVAAGALLGGTLATASLRIAERLIL
jgi:undecaprenyl-diphosphatase